MYVPYETPQFYI